MLACLSRLESCRQRAIAAQISSGRSGFTSWPTAPTTSGRAPASEAMTGAPQAIASRAGSPNPSQRLAITKARQRLSSCSRS